MRIAIASDHGGYEQKQLLIPFIEKLGYEVIDKGPANEESVDYPDYALLVALAINDGEADRGVLVCGTGIGMAIAANKCKGIRAANVICPEFAVLSREHNNANVVTLSGRFVSLETNEEILKAFFETDVAGERHERRVAKIMELES